jgi:hypothetical protein
MVRAPALPSIREGFMKSFCMSPELVQFSIEYSRWFLFLPAFPRRRYLIAALEQIPHLVIRLL